MLRLRWGSNINILDVCVLETSLLCSKVSSIVFYTYNVQYHTYNIVNELWCCHSQISHPSWQKQRQSKSQFHLIVCVWSGILPISIAVTSFIHSMGVFCMCLSACTYHHCCLPFIFGLSIKKIGSKQTLGNLTSTGNDCCFLSGRCWSIFTVTSTTPLKVLLLTTQ